MSLCFISHQIMYERTCCVKRILLYYFGREPKWKNRKIQFYVRNSSQQSILIFEMKMLEVIFIIILCFILREIMCGTKYGDFFSGGGTEFFEGDPNVTFWDPECVYDHKKWCSAPIGTWLRHFQHHFVARIDFSIPNLSGLMSKNGGFWPF